MQQSANKRYIVLGSSVEALTKHSDGFWRDDFNTIWALAEESNSVDPVSRCGVGWFSLPEAMDANEVCGYHDYRFSSSVYQAFYTRAEADQKLKEDLIAMNYPIIGPLFYKLSRWFGARFWENDKTR